MPHRRPPPRIVCAACALLVAVVAACAGGAGDAEPVQQAAPDAAPSTAGGDQVEEPAVAEPAGDEAWPTPEWETVSPADAGLDPAALDAMAAAAEAGGSECLVVTKDGALVGEWYWNGSGPATEREVFSVTKSITSTLVGIAQDRGLLDIDDPASTYIEAWKGTPSEDVTIRNLVSNDSGRFQDFQTDYIEMATKAADKTAFSVELDQQHAPGSTWVYNNAAIQTLDEVLEVATGMPTAEFAQEALFEPLGMGTTMNLDAAGNTLTFMGAQASCRDLARFGLLHLRGGEWDGEQIVSEAWVEEATSPSQSLNEGYGFLWWLGRTPSSAVASGTPGEAPAAEPEEPTGATYAAIGLFGQLVGVYPDAGVVATRLGADKGPSGASFGLGELAAGVTQASDGAGAEDAVG